MSRFALYRRNDLVCITAKYLRSAGILFILLTIMPRLGAAPGAVSSATSSAVPGATPGAAPSATPSATPSAIPGSAPSSDPNADPTIDPSAATGAAAVASETLLLEVYVNGHSTGKVGEFTMRRGKLMARSDELHDLG